MGTRDRSAGQLLAWRAARPTKAGCSNVIRLWRAPRPRWDTCPSNSRPVRPGCRYFADQHHPVGYWIRRVPSGGVKSCEPACRSCNPWLWPHAQRLLRHRGHLWETHAHWRSCDISRWFWLLLKVVFAENSLKSEGKSKAMRPGWPVPSRPVQKGRSMEHTGPVAYVLKAADLLEVVSSPLCRVAVCTGSAEQQGPSLCIDGPAHCYAFADYALPAAPGTLLSAQVDVLCGHDAGNAWGPGIALCWPGGRFVAST